MVFAAVVVALYPMAVELAKEDDQIFIIGGAQVYKYAMENNIGDTLDITLVHHEFEADVFFPEIDPEIWKEVAREDFKADEKNKFDYSFLRFQKRTN